MSFRSIVPKPESLRFLGQGLGLSGGEVYGKVSLVGGYICRLHDPPSETCTLRCVGQSRRKESLILAEFTSLPPSVSEPAYLGVWTCVS